MKNVYYLDFVFPKTALVTKPENPGTISFPSIPQNIKANQAYISIDKLVLQNNLDNSDTLNNFCVNVQTTIPSANYFSTFFDDNEPRNTGYGETVPLESFIATHADSADLKIGVMSYVNNNLSRHLLCANPFGNKFSVSFYSVNENGGVRALNTAILDNIILTLRVELLEEEIFR